MAAGAAAVGFLVAIALLTRWAAAIGGAIVGLAISAMHYTGILAYRVAGIVSWSSSTLTTSIVLAVLFSALALHIAVRHRSSRGLHLATVALVVSIVSLHFTGMAAFHVAA